MEDFDENEWSVPNFKGEEREDDVKASVEPEEVYVEDEKIVITKEVNPIDLSLLESNEAINNPIISNGKLGYKKWDIVAKAVTSQQRNFLTAIMDIGKGVVSNDKTLKLSFCGEENYVKELRPKLVARKILKDKKQELNETDLDQDPESVEEKVTGKKKVKTPKAPVVKKADLIRAENTKRLFTENLNKFISYLNDESNSGIMIGATQPYAEFRFAGLMIMAKNIPEKENAAFIEMIFALIKFHDYVSETGNKEISATCLKDVLKLIRELIKDNFFNFREAFKYYPQFIFKTKYDNYFPSQGVGIYASQAEVLKHVRENKEILIINHSMIGSGKTTGIITIVGNIMAHIKDTVLKDTVLIACLPNDHVRLPVAQWAYSLGIPFSIVSIDKVDHNVYCESFNNRTTRDPKKHRKCSCVLFIADIYSTLNLLVSKNNNRNYILFYDEPTVGADQVNSLMTKFLVRIMANAPPITILASATQPSYEDAKEFYDSFKQLHPNAKIVSVSAHETKIGCHLYDSTGNQVLPHHGCVDKPSLQKVTETIQINPLLGRFLTATSIYSIADTFKSKELFDPKLLEEFFSQSKNFTQTAIQRKTLEILGLAFKQSDETIKELCRESSHHENSSVDLNNLFGSEAHKFLGGCMIVTANPVGLALELGKNIIETVKFDRLLNDYTNAHDQWEANIAKYNKDTGSVEDADMGFIGGDIMGKISGGMSSIRTTQRKSGKAAVGGRSDNKKINSETGKVTVKGGFKSEFDRMQHQADMTNDEPKWPFPPELIPNSEAHMKKHRIPPKNCASILRPNDIPYSESKVRVELLCLLAAGIGIYSLDDKSLDKAYTDAVIELAVRGCLPFIFTDTGIAFGANILITHAIIDDRDGQNSIAGKLSVKTMYQIFGRAGRFGISHAAHIHTLGDYLINKIKAHISGTLVDPEHDEAKNIIDIFRKLKN